MPSDFGERLAALRREHDLSQEELADCLGLSRQAISNWERAQSAPDTANLLALAGFYGLSLDELILQDSAGDAGTGAGSALPSSRAPRTHAVAIAMTVVLSIAYYSVLAQPLMASTVDDVTEMFGLTVSPALALTIFLLEAVAVAIPLLVLALALRTARSRIPLIWLVPVVTFMVFAGAQAASSLLFGLPVREYTGIGGYETQSVTIKADVLGIVLGCACVALAQRVPSVRPTSASSRAPGAVL